MFVVCLLLLLDALLRIHPLPSHTPRGAGALTWFNSRRQLRVFPCLRAAQGAPGLRFSRQVRPFPGVNERALAQELHAALLRGLRGNLGRRLRLQEGVFQHRDLGHPPGRGRPGHPPLGRRPAEPRAQGWAGLGGAGDLRPQERGRRPQTPRHPRRRGEGSQCPGTAQTWDPGGPRCLSPPVWGPGRCSTRSSLPQLRQSHREAPSPPPTPSFIPFSQRVLGRRTLFTLKAPRKVREIPTLLSEGSVAAAVPIPSLFRPKRRPGWAALILRSR